MLRVLERIRGRSARMAELAQRVERLEGNQARIQTDVLIHLQRADVAVEDLVAAVEALRTRIEALESAPTQGEA